MAATDYRLCDRCACKAFYDANLNYEVGREPGAHQAGQPVYYKLQNLGDWAVLCTACAKSFEAVIVPRAGRRALTEGGEA